MHGQGRRDGRERPEAHGQGGEKSRQAASFGAAAAAYERGRPPYPPEAVAWLVPAGARTVVDVGAGTGKLTRALAAPGREVVAVEPSAGMREQFARVLPGTRVLAGTAEAVPLPDASADTVVSAQAWHWVDPARAVPEAARVLRPGGRLALVWNSRDESVPWVAELGRILREYAAAPAEDRQTDRVGAPFGPVERRDFRWRHPVSAAEIADMVASRSYVITLAPAVRARLLDRVRALLAAERPGEMPYVTECHRAHR
ncbi:class I SAM-dependent methyltransferase [Streptomyces sp. MAR4 CNX-425]|uniref:class I SAM-dependent methyltransferase n=1 Tax=Streptomyces sp. MAR4 CNX-425 TaxID=3406343 RepID=UPI003B507103